jgi:replicative DNA helicase
MAFMKILKGLNHISLPQRFSMYDLEELVKTYQKQMNADALQYLTSRGLQGETIQYFRIGYESSKIGFELSHDPLSGFFDHRLVIPLTDQEGQVVDLLGRAMDHREPKYKALVGAESEWFHAPILGKSDDVILCQGIFDVMTLQQEGLPAVSLPDNVPFREAHTSSLYGKRVFICFGNDERGRRESFRVAHLLKQVANEVYVLALPQAVKDVNDFFLRVESPSETFVELINQTIQQAMAEPISPDSRQLTSFYEEYSKRQRGQLDGIPTGFDPLDQILLGGLRSGLYLVYGSTSVGKTTWLRQIADHMASQGQPVIYVSTDMSAFELWAKSIARQMKVPVREVLTGGLAPESVAKSNEDYQFTAKHLWTLEAGVRFDAKQLGELVQNMMRGLSKRPVIIIDHIGGLHLTSNGSSGGNGSKETTQSVLTALKHGSNEWNLPIIAAIPYFLKENPNLFLMEAISDVIIVLEGSSANQSSDEVKLIIEKNRNGSAGEVTLQFDKEKASFSTLKKSN